MQAFELSEIQARNQEDDNLYLEFLRVPDLSMGLYTLPAGSEDLQQPHSEDEVYYVTRGRAMIDVGGEEKAVTVGSILYVPAGVPHRFHSIVEDLSVLVFFAPAEGSGVTSKQFYHVQRDGFLLSTDPSLLDLDAIHAYLTQEAYWARGRSREVVARTISSSLCFGVYVGAPHRGEASQIGFARVITDYAVYAHLADLFILPPNRGRGLGKWLVQSILEHPQLQDVQKWSLDTRDAHGLYEQFGFTVAGAGTQMEFKRDG